MFWYCKKNKFDNNFMGVGNYKVMDKSISKTFFDCEHDLDTVINEYKIDFKDVIVSMIEERKIKEYSKIYKPVNMPKQVFHRILKGEQKPSKDSAIKLAFAFKLTGINALDFIGIAGYSLMNTNERDMIITFCLIEEKSINEANKILCKYNQKPLFGKK